MIVVTGSVTARPESFEALLQACLDHVHRSRLEHGCISHAVHIDCENPLRLFFYEQWRDIAALKLHFGRPGSADLMAAVQVYAAETEPLTIIEASPTG